MNHFELTKTFDVFNLAATQVRGIRILEGKTQLVAGVFSNVGNLINSIENAVGGNVNWYFVFNQIDDSVLKNKVLFNQNNECLRILKNGGGIADCDIVKRRWVMLDFDPCRPSGTSSTDEQLQKAKQVAQRVWEFLFYNGFYDYVGCLSGNGYHIMLPCDMVVNEQTDRLVKDFVKVISMLFSTKDVEIDVAVSNRSRLTKLYGTLAMKGENSELTPHRLSRIEHCPNQIKSIDMVYFQKVVRDNKIAISEPVKYNNYGRSSRFDVKEFLKSHNIAFKERSLTGGVKYLLEECPFNSEHKSPDSAVFQFDDGNLGFKCFHNSCSSYHWHDFREKFEPNSCKSPSFTSEDYNKYVQTNVNLKEQWVSFENISYEQADSVLRIPTGYEQLDSCLGGGLASGGITVLTGVNGCGKTVFLNNIVLNICDKNFKVGLFSGEMQSWRLKAWIRKIARGLNQDNEQNNERIDQSLKDTLFVYDNSCGSDWGNLFESIQKTVEEKGLNLLVLDNLACMKLSSNRNEKLDQQSSFIKELADYARSKSIHIILIAHPRKSFGVVRKDDIAGSYDLSNMADNVLIMHKVNEDFFKNAKDFWRKEVFEDYKCYDSLIEVAKNRDTGEEKVIGLFYEHYSKRLKAFLAETRHYKWELYIIKNN
ncbi:MAG: DnaB-like helicase C-terminal domain-containing protein [Bacteroidales bacterium]|nr:DnaB-like helicase C-terminal domain-containing protein [Bacteroidales bacterium]